VEVTFTGSSVFTELKCSSATETGQLTSGTAGELKITYKGCRDFAGSCTGPGQASGTVVTPNLSVTPVYLNAGKTIWGFKLTPIGTNVFAECTSTAIGSQFARTITGSVLGNVFQSVGSTTKTLNLHQGWGAYTEQEYQQIEGAGTKYHLQQTVVNKSNGAELTSESALWLENPITAGASLTINP
jgi:hypothetical protein